MVRVGIIGYGYWGPNLVRNFLNTSECTVSIVSDIREERLKTASVSYPFLRTTTSANEILFCNEIDAVVIATPVKTHFKLAEMALKNGKHVLVEKPITNCVKDAEKLIELAKKFNKILMVDHTFLYHGAVKKIKEFIENDIIGEVSYFDSTRINLGLFQSDINVLWDLAVHDLSILLYLLKEKPIAVQATGISHTENGIENIAYLTIFYESNLLAHLNCSWSSPVKIRYILVGGSKKMVVFNDLEQTEKIKVYDTGYSFKNDEEKRGILVDYRVGDIFSPKLETKEALHGVTSDFINSILKMTPPVSDEQSGLEVVKILEGAQQSLYENGNKIFLK